MGDVYGWAEELDGTAGVGVGGGHAVAVQAPVGVYAAVVAVQQGDVGVAHEINILRERILPERAIYYSYKFKSIVLCSIDYPFPYSPPPQL